MKNHKQFYD